MVKPLVILLAGLLVGACSNSAPPYPPTPTSVPPAPQAATKVQTASEIYELRERCAKDAMAWFKQNHSEQAASIPIEGGGTTNSLQPTYSNHYSQAHNGCFVVLSQLTTFKVGAHSKSKDSTSQSDTLWDVNENAQRGALVVKDLGETTTCNVSGTTCASKNEWLSLAKTYIAE